MATLKRRRLRGEDKLIGQNFYTSYWPDRGDEDEIYFITFYGVANGNGGHDYCAGFTRREAQRLMKHFTRYLQEESARRQRQHGGETTAA